MRIGVIGGTFDPIHLGHMLIAKETNAHLELDRVLFVPAGAPPHKVGHTISDPESRLEMVQLAISGHPNFGISRIDVDRRGPSYTVDTIRLLRDEWGMDAEIYFLIGADSLVDLPIWHQPEHLLRLCQVVALRRPGYEVDLDELDQLLPGAAFLVRMMDIPMLDISSTEIRQRVRQGHSIHGLVPPAVERYIDKHGLYRDFREDEGA
jgi:nicotinate-nucleotide adenylyltransferase